MPKIDAPTLLEHRARQRAALLAAARESFKDNGFTDMTFSDIAARAGLARSSVYEYFTSKEDIMIAVCEVELPKRKESIRKAMLRARSPRDEVAAWIRVQLKLVAEDEHKLVTAMMNAEVGPETRERIALMHMELAEPLTAALAAMGWKNESLTASLLQGIVFAGAHRIEGGEKPGTVIRSAVNLALDGLG